MSAAAKIAVALALLVAAGGGGYYAGRRTVPARVAESRVVDDKRDGSWGSTATAAKTTAKTRAPSVRERFDPKTGALVERLTLGATTSTSTATATVVAGGQEHEQTHVETRVTTEYATPPRLRLSIGLGYDSRRLAPPPTLALGAELRLTPQLFGTAAWAYASVTPPVAVPVLSNRTGTVEWAAGLKLQGEW